jgi:LPS sulfotransferase NodH
MASASPKKPEWAPRMWQGSDFLAWLRLLARNRFAVDPRYAYLAVIATVTSFGHTALRVLQGILHGREIRATRQTEPPIFIIGHWRTGTTLLHELLIQDTRFGYPTNYECFVPNHFVVSEWIAKRFFWFLFPSRRPMDNMRISLDHPQEEEFALCLLGAGSPYDMLAFPNRPPCGQEFLDLVNVTPRQLRRWRRIFKTFLRTVAFQAGKPLVLKSPPHSARIPVLLQMFPRARFVHIVRDPYVVFPSTVNLWRMLSQTQGLQKPTGAGLDEYVLNTFVRLYERLEEGKRLVEPRQFFELRYEELIADPVGQMHKLYDHLGLGGFEQYLPRLEAYLATLKGYETNRYQLTADQRERITQRWGAVIRQYGYG